MRDQPHFRGVRSTDLRVGIQKYFLPSLPLLHGLRWSILASFFALGTKSSYSTITEVSKSSSGSVCSQSSDGVFPRGIPPFSLGLLEKKPSVMWSQKGQP